MRILSIAVMSIALMACSGETPPPAAAPEQAQSPQVVGGDRDKFGCIASAGYRWCAVKLSCVRPFELAKEEGFENTEDGFLQYCENKPPKKN